MGRDQAREGGNDHQDQARNDHGCLDLDGRKCRKTPSKRRPNHVTEVGSPSSHSMGTSGLHTMGALGRSISSRDLPGASAGASCCRGALAVCTGGASSLASSVR
jgi:hypothetical protein